MVFVFSLLIGIQLIYSQVQIVNDSIEIEFKKAKTISNSYLHSNLKMKRSQNEKRVLVRCDVKAIFDQEIDINAFSLVDTANKYRYRIVSYFGYKKGISLLTHGNLGRVHLKKEVLNKKGKQYKFLPPYDKSLHDSFATYSFPDYKNIEVPLRYYNVVSGEVISVIYYSPSQKPNFRADMQFVVRTDQNKPQLQLYYGEKLISDVMVKL